MKVLFIGADARKGVSSKTGKPYSMARLYYAIPAEPKQTEAYDYRATGFRVIEVDMEPDALAHFTRCKPLTEVDVRLEPVPANPSRNIVTGLV